MPAKNVIKEYEADCYYHLYNRGVNRQTIFEDKQDEAVFLSYLKTYLLPKDIEGLNLTITSVDSTPIEKSDAARLLRLNNFASEIDLVAYCLMNNHYHLLVKQHNERSIEALMKSLMTRYTMYFNRRHDRIGPLFQGNYRGVKVETDEQLLYLTRYIHRNPIASLKRSNLVRVDLYEELSRKPSSYPVYLDKYKQDWVKPQEILAFFAADNQGATSYQSFVESSENDLEDKSDYVMKDLYPEGMDLF